MKTFVSRMAVTMSPSATNGLQGALDIPFDHGCRHAFAGCPRYAVVSLIAWACHTERRRGRRKRGRTSIRRFSYSYYRVVPLPPLLLPTATLPELPADWPSHPRLASCPHPQEESAARAKRQRPLPGSCSAPTWERFPPRRGCRRPNLRQPRTDSGTAAVQSRARVALCMPRQQHVIFRQRIFEPA